MIDPKKILELTKITKKVRIEILKMSYFTRSAHTGGALSCIEILVALYFHVMRNNPKQPDDPERDRLIFSKAHDAKALYAVLSERGYFKKKFLSGYEQNHGKLPGHATRHCVPGVEVSAGSLGHGLSMAVGIAYAGKNDQKNYRVYTILSDGECDEGSTWEAILFAGHHKLKNLVAIVDYNKLQGFGYTKDILDLEPFCDKWKAFGWDVKNINGHDFREIIPTLNKPNSNKPFVIIANTIKGYQGMKQHINQISSQYVPPTKEELDETIERLSKS